MAENNRKMELAQKKLVSRSLCSSVYLTGPFRALNVQSKLGGAVYALLKQLI